MQALHDELLDIILAMFFPAELPPVLQVCHRLHACGVPHLYRCVELSSGNVLGLWFRMITSNPKLARPTLRLAWYERGHTFPAHISDEVLELFTRSLRFVINLRHLVFWWFPDFPEEGEVTPCPFLPTHVPLLESMSTTLPWSDTLVDFISAHQNLQTLDVNCLPEDPLTPSLVLAHLSRPNIAPLLTKILLSADCAKILVPGRPIRDLTLFFHDESKDEIVSILDAVSLSSVPLLFLSCHFSAWPESSVDRLGHNFPDLQYLHINNGGAKSWSWTSAEFTQFRHRLVLTTRAMPTLAQIHLKDFMAMTWRRPRSPHLVPCAVEHDLVLALNKSVPSLTECIFLTSRVWRKVDHVWIPDPGNAPGKQYLSVLNIDISTPQGFHYWHAKFEAAGEGLHKARR